MRGADLCLAVPVQEGSELHEAHALPLCSAPPDQGEEQVHLPLLQGKPQAPPPLGQDPQEGCQLEVHTFPFHISFNVDNVADSLHLLDAINSSPIY